MINKVLYSLLALSVLAGLFPLQMRIDRDVTIYQLRPQLMGGGVRPMPGTIAGQALVMGFGPLASDLLWLQVNEAWANKEWYKMLPLMRGVVTLQPHFIEAWAVGGWHLLYNISHDKRDYPEERKRWMDTGTEYLREGIVYNPSHYQLYFELGFSYYHKLERYDLAAEAFKQSVQFEHPSYVEHMLAHAYEKSDQLEKALETWKELSKRPLKTEAEREVAERFIKELEEKINFR